MNVLTIYIVVILILTGLEMFLSWLAIPLLYPGLEANVMYIGAVLFSTIFFQYYICCVYQTFT